MNDAITVSIAIKYSNIDLSFFISRGLTDRRVAWRDGCVAASHGAAQLSL